MDYRSIILVLFYTAMLLELILIALVDMKERMIIQKALWILLAGSAVVIYLDEGLSLMDACAAMALLFIVLSLVYYFSRKSIGWGDVKLCSCVAPYFGVDRAFSMLFISMVTCGLVALTVIAVNKGNGKKALPFAPFVAIGTIAVLFIQIFKLN